MKNLKKLMFGLVALVLAFGLVFSVSAFKTKGSSEKASRAGNFYKYIGPNYSEIEVRDYSNYERSEDGCEDGENLCGVFLPSDPSGTDQPVEAELDAVADNLWISQDTGISTTPNTILMKE